ATNSNRIVTASRDRNAYAWQQAPDPLTGTIAICSFDPDNNWWVSRQLKKPIRSTVLLVDWHPNGLARAGCADMKARVFFAHIKDVDKRPPPSVWGEKLPFNTVCGEYSSSSGGWVHSVGFSPSGDVLAFATDPLSFTSLPYVTLTWTSEDSLVAAGHDCQPVLFSGGSSGWQAIGSLDDTTAPKSSGGARGALTGSSPSPVGRLNSAAFNTFRNADSPDLGSSPGGGSALATDTELFTVHQNTITDIRPYEGALGAVSGVGTIGVGGMFVIWDVDAVSGISTRVSGLRMG
ncbi:actin-like protein ARPC3, partial [Lactarius psammicola]